MYHNFSIWQCCISPISIYLVISVLLDNISNDNDTDISPTLETITHYASLLIYRYFWSRSMHFQFYSYIMQYIENNIIKYVEYIRLLLNRQKLNLKTFSACGQGCGLDPKKCQSGSKTHGRLLRLQQQKLSLRVVYVVYKWRL